MWLKRGRINPPENVIFGGFMMIFTVFAQILQNCYQILDSHKRTDRSQRCAADIDENKQLTCDVEMFEVDAATNDFKHSDVSDVGAALTLQLT